MNFELNDSEVRVLGCLIEKQITTPDYYPLTLNALVTACNQKSNRNPVVDYDEKTVVREYLPAMGFTGPKLLANLIAVATLSPEWLDWMAERDMSLKAARLIAAVPDPALPALFSLFDSIKPGANLVRELVPLLMEIAGRENKSVADLLADPELQSISGPRRGERNQRLDQVMN